MKPLLRWLGLVLAAGLALQLYFVARVALMAVANPESTAFQRSEAVRLARAGKLGQWRQHWVDYDGIADNLKRAVIASEDDGFVHHGGVDWEAVQEAWERNERAEQRAAKAAQRAAARAKAAAAATAAGRPPKIVGGSTITQQLAKNLFFSGERSLVRKGQELVVTLLLEALLSKQRILELYLNSVEWGEGVFGAGAAAQRYFNKPADRLAPIEAARLAVMLPRPRYFESLPHSPYVASRSATIAARMPSAELP